MIPISTLKGVVAQLVEHWSVKPVVTDSTSVHANYEREMLLTFEAIRA